MITPYSNIISVTTLAPLDADYQAVLDYATTQGYTLPSAGQQTLQNQLIVDLKAGGIWSKLDTFAVFATDGDEDFALIDWIRLTQYTAVNSPTFTPNQGFQGDGVSSSIDTNFNPFINGVNYTLNNASFGYYMRLYDTAPSPFEFTIRCSTNAYIRYTNMRKTINSTTRFDGGVSVGANNQFAALTRTSSSNMELYLNGAQVESMTLTANILPNDNYTTLALTDSQLSMVYTGGNLTTEQSDFYTAFYTNYLTSL